MIQSPRTKEPARGPTRKALSQQGPRSAILPILLLAVATVGCLAPFAGKAFHIDDPLFLWTARQIASHPLDPYDFKVNWYGTEMAMTKVTKNPPLTSYYIALVASIFGIREIPLHLSFLVFSIAVVIGTYILARRWCSQPMIAALAGLVTPVFLVSSTSVMSDVMMLAFWVWAIVLWVRGMESNNRAALLGASFLVALSTLTKYYGACLIPLLMAYSIVQKRRLGWWALYFLIPVAILVWYETATRSLYGKGLFFDAAVYAGDAQDYARAEFFTRMMITLSFTGGCLVTALFYAPLLWSRRALIIAALGTAAGIAVLPLAGQVGAFALHHADGGVRWALVTHTGLFAAAGIGVLALSIPDLRQRRDAGSWLLFLWLVGTFIFAGFINWTANARSILPMAPAVGILLMRRIDQRTDLRRKDLTWLALPLVPAAVLGLMVTRADYILADAQRSAAGVIKQKYDREPGPLWFQGHWGFQWYMESVGAKALDLQGDHAKFGEIVISPKNNTNTNPMRPDLSELLEIIERPSSRWLTTLSDSIYAGFHASEYGPVPFIFGKVPPERYRVYRLQAGAKYHFALANALDDRGKVDEAIKEYQTAINLDPRYPDPHINLGLLLAKQGRRDEAVREYQIAIYIKPDSAEAHNNLAIEYYYKRDYAAAWREVGLARRFGHNPHPIFLRALSEKMPEP